MKATFARAIFGLCTMLVAFAAPGTTATVNYNDMWWNPSESGWGVNIAQQGSNCCYRITFKLPSASLMTLSQT